MSKLNTKINTELGELTVKDFFKECLKEILVNNPPKRFLGTSGWWHTLGTGLAKSGLAKGGVSPCCEKGNWCEANKPCGYEHNCESEELDKTLNELIELI